MMNCIFALVAMGYGPDDPLTCRETREFAKFEIEDADTIRLQPCVSPVWDTAIAMVALEEAGVAPDDPALVSAADWILSKQILGPGDWQVKNKDAEPGGWAFEFRNDFYPDVDDTAFVLMALQRVKCPETTRMEAALRRGVQWLLSMQNRDGGWGAFDRDNDRRFLCNIPFADHNAMIDPSTADVTARVLECLGRFGWSAEHPAIQRAVKFLLKDQCGDGSWFGRWGVNYVYGTWSALCALNAAGLDAGDPCVRKAAGWLIAIQNPDGGWGEDCTSYKLDYRGYEPAPSNASQTAWALLGLMAAGEVDHSAVARGMAYLQRTQDATGLWQQDAYTGGGFPRVFYLRYHGYPAFFPLWALARYRNLKRGNVRRVRQGM
jgi:squalene-hopene/tetraprenyl-beta-curcumene cyclase